MKIKHNISLALLLCTFFLKMNAQQEPQYTQFMYNKLPLNAAYTGTREVLSIRALYRDQWTGFDGAPKTVSFSINSPFKKERSSLGFYMVHDRLGVTNQTWFDVSYAYKIPLTKDQKWKLSIGLNAGMVLYKSALTEVPIVDQSDFVFQNNVSKVMPDVGAGLYLYHTNFYFGVSVPNFVNTKLFNKDVVDQIRNNYSDKVIMAHRTPHLFIMTGGVIPAGKILDIRPQVLAKYITSTQQKIPFELDLNLSFMFLRRFNIGATFRTTFKNKSQGTQLQSNDAIAALLEVWATKQLMIGYSYDYSLSKLHNYNKGSHEVIIGYDFAFKKDKLNTPRFF